MNIKQKKVGEFGSTIVQIILDGFCEKTFLAERKLTFGKYLGAYTAAACQGVVLGLRFRQVPLPMMKLICEEGAESDLREELRRQVSNVVSEFRGQEPDLLDVSMRREQTIQLAKLGRRDLIEDPFALTQLMEKETVDIKHAYGALVGCFALFLGLGLFESEWIEQVYLRFMPGEDQLQKDALDRLWNSCAVGPPS
ncbi:MAG: hypothetical protein WCE63_03985 [Acidobacteriaceae bacterium]